jgi:hypothetical protein
MESSFSFSLSVQCEKKPAYVCTLIDLQDINIILGNVLDKVAIIRCKFELRVF